MVYVIVSPGVASVTLSVLVTLISAAEVTVHVSVAVPLFPEEEVRSPVVLTYTPATLVVTSTSMEKMG